MHTLASVTEVSCSKGKQELKYLLSNKKITEENARPLRGQDDQNTFEKTGKSIEKNMSQ